MSLALYVDSRIKTVVFLSLNRHKTGGLEGRKARGQRVTAAQQSYDWRGVEPENRVSLHVNSRKTRVLLSFNSLIKDGGLGTAYPCTSTVVRLGCSCLSTAMRLEDWKGEKPGDSMSHCPWTSTVVRLDCSCLSTAMRLEDWKA